MAIKVGASVTASDKLNLLLPWLNGALDTDYAAVRRAIAAFVRSFDGSAEAGHLEVVTDPRPAHLKKTTGPTDDELDDLGATLQILLAQGFGDQTLADLAFPGASLRFAVRSSSRVKPKWHINRGTGKKVVMGGAKALRDYHAAGAYVLQVHGPMTELVPFLIAHLLTQPGMVAVRRCPAPGCQHFLVTAAAARGRPQIFCSGSCRLRAAEQKTHRRMKR